MAVARGRSPAPVLRAFVAAKLEKEKLHKNIHQLD
jgi:hypothetical protein